MSFGLSHFAFPGPLLAGLRQLERFSYDNKQTEKKPFDWFVERIQTRVAFGWLSERSTEKKIHARRTNTTRLANRKMPSPY